MEARHGRRKYRVKCSVITDPTVPGCFTGIDRSFFESYPEMVEQTEEVEIYEFTSEYDMDRILDLQQGVIEYEVRIL